jgi:hypothetical protein
MYARRLATRVDMHSRAVPRNDHMGAPRTESLGQTIHGILITALLVGGLGLAAVATPGHATGNVAAHHQSGQIRHQAQSDPRSTGHIIDSPWMY